MIFPLFSEMNQKIKNDLDLNEETFIQPQELVAYFNEAVDMVFIDTFHVYGQLKRELEKFSKLAKYYFILM
jgi:hypothetical protein